ncbi:putative aconitate hydratase [Venturia inaequalis]|nr:putative aconitate hydratase [Venturia inaequalis]
MRKKEYFDPALAPRISPIELPSSHLHLAVKSELDVEVEGAEKVSNRITIEFDESVLADSLINSHAIKSPHILLTSHTRPR